MWSFYGICKLAHAANRSIVPPKPLQAPFPWEVAEKQHSAEIPKSSL